MPVFYSLYGWYLLSALGQYHFSSGFINHNIAQNDVFYSVYYAESICFYLSSFAVRLSAVEVQNTCEKSLQTNEKSIPKH